MGYIHTVVHEICVYMPANFDVSTNAYSSVMYPIVTVEHTGTYIHTHVHMTIYHKLLSKYCDCFEERLSGIYIIDRL